MLALLASRRDGVNTETTGKTSWFFLRGLTGLRVEERSLSSVTVFRLMKPGFAVEECGRFESAAFNSASRTTNQVAVARANAVTQVINQNSSALASNTQLIARQTRLRFLSIAGNSGGTDSPRESGSDRSDPDKP